MTVALCYAVAMGKWILLGVFMKGLYKNYTKTKTLHQLFVIIFSYIG